MSEIPDLSHLLGDIRARAIGLTSDIAPELAAIVDRYLPDPLDPAVTIPIATACAVGGDSQDAAPLAAAWALTMLSVRILDDIADGDNPSAVHSSLGVGRAAHAAAAMQTATMRLLLDLTVDVHARQEIVNRFLHASAQLWAGQDADLRAAWRTLDDYVRVVEQKTASGFAAIAVAGALTGTKNRPWVDACHACGRHLGLMIQLLDDLEACWRPDAQGDLERGRLTFPVLFALDTSQDNASHLRDLVSNPARNSVEIRKILDATGQRERVVWSALEERDLALAALRGCPDPRGMDILQLYVDWIFRDIGDYLGSDGVR